MVLLVVIAVKLVGMQVAATASYRAFTAKDYLATASAGDWMLVLNFTEEWKAHYDRGTGLAGHRSYAAAEQELKQAVALAPKAESCPPRTNLVITYDRHSVEEKKAGRTDRAEMLVQQAVKVMKEAPKGCFQNDPSKAKDQQTDKRLEQERKRLDPNSQQKKNGNNGNSTPQPTSSPSPSSTPKSEEEKKEDQLKKEQEKANQQHQKDQNNQGGSGGDSADKPW